MSGECYLYMNGIEVAHASPPSNFVSWRLGNTIEIGGGGSNGWAATNVSVNDYRIYDHILSIKEVKELAKAKVLHYTFNQLEEPTTNVIDPSYTTSYGIGTYTVTPPSEPTGWYKAHGTRTHTNNLIFAGS